MTDYHATQLTGSACAGRNCAAASGAMGLAAAGGPTLTADQFRSQSGVSCVPGAHSQSGGLFISDVIRVFARNRVTIDYGKIDAPPAYTRWSPPMLAIKLQMGFGAVLLGDYDALPKKYRASATFLGDHSTWAHDYRAADQTVCWHDPLRTKPIRIPITAAIAYWQKPGSSVRGFAGFVRIAVAPPDTSTEEPEEPMRKYPRIAVDAVPVRITPKTDRTYGWLNMEHDEIGKILPDFGTRWALPCVLTDGTIDHESGGLERRTGFLTTGDDGTFVLATDVTVVPAVVDCSDAVAVQREKDREAVLAAVREVLP